VTGCGTPPELAEQLLFDATVGFVINEAVRP
jgi:hypothetical protein